MKEEDLSTVESTDEEDLALFKDMRTREREEFLHRLSDDSDESLSIKLGSFSSFKFYVCGKHNDLLDADMDKTDYNWLLTPPGTPLFPTLDMKTPHVEISERSIVHSKPRTISRIARTENSPRRTQNSYSPQRSSTVSSSSSVNNYSRGRVSSKHSSGNLNLHHSTSTVRSSTGTAFASTASARSSTLSSGFSTSTLHRSSTGSNSSSSLAGKAAPSLQQRNRWGSSSPQRQARQLSPGFSSQPPPNLCTTVSDHNALHKRGSSPASRCGGETGGKSRRPSASPTFPRTASENHNCSPYVSQNKDCTISSNTDVLTDSRQKIKRVSYVSNRTQSPSKGPGRSKSARSVSDVVLSKRSLNSMTQQKNHRQNSQSMFRPLLTNAPITAFYPKKPTPLPWQANANNSSVSTNGNNGYEHRCIASPSEVTDCSTKNPGNENSKCFSSHDDEKPIAFEKVEIKNQDEGSHLDSCGSQKSNDNNTHELENALEVEYRLPTVTDNCDKLNLSELSSRDTNDRKHGKLLLHNEVNCQFGICENVNHGHAGHAGHACQADHSLKDRILTSDSQRQKVTSYGFDYTGSSDTSLSRDTSQDLYQKEPAVKWNLESRDSHPVDDQGPLSSHNMGSNEVCDKNCEGIHVAVQRKVDANMHKVNNNQREYAFREESRNQHSQSCFAQARQCLEDHRSVPSAVGDGKSFGAHDMIQTSQVDVQSELNRKESSVLREGNINRADLENPASKGNLKVAFSVLTTSGDHGSTYETEDFGKDSIIKDSVVLLADFISDRCSSRSKASENAIAQTESRTNVFKYEGLETYSGEDSILMLQESLLASQKDEKLLKGITSTAVNQEANCLSKYVSSLETQEQEYSCNRRLELSENSGCHFSEKDTEDTLTQASFQPFKQDKEHKDSGGDVTIEICNSLQVAGDEFLSEYSCGEESKSDDCKQDSVSNLHNGPVPVTVSPSNLETVMELSAFSRLEGDNGTDVNAIHSDSDCDKARQGKLSKGDGAFHANRPRRCLSRSMTLEEAADTVLFCSSIVHDLVYKSTMIATQKEIPSLTPIQTVTTTTGRKSQPKRRNSCRRAAAQRMLTYKSVNSRQTVAHLHTPSTRIETAIKDQQPVMHVSIGERNEPLMPKKVNSKCCCTIL